MSARPAGLSAAMVLTAACLPLGEGLAVAGLLLWGAQLLRRRQALGWSALRRPPWGKPLQALALYFACALVATAWGGAGHVAAGLGRQFVYLFFVLVAVTRTQVTPAALTRAAQAFAASLSLAAAFGLWQAAADGHLLEGLTRAAYGQASQALVPGTGRSVAAGFYYHRLKMAHVLVVGLCGLWPQLLWPASRRAAAGAWALTVLWGVALAQTFAHGAWLAALVAGAMVVLLRLQAWRRSVAVPRRWAVAATLAAAGAVGLAGTAAAPRLQAWPQAAAQHGRTLIWEQAVHILEAHPFGIGLGNYPSVVQRHYAALTPNAAPPTYPHQVWLAAWAEAGPVGLAGFVAFWWLLAATFGRAVAAAGASAARQRRAAAGAALVTAYACLGTGHDLFYHQEVGMAFCAALAWAMPDEEPE